MCEHSFCFVGGDEAPKVEEGKVSAQCHVQEWKTSGDLQRNVGHALRDDRDVRRTPKG